MLIDYKAYKLKYTSLLTLQVINQNNTLNNLIMYLDIWSCDNVNRKLLQINKGAAIVLHKCKAAWFILKKKPVFARTLKFCVSS